MRHFIGILIVAFAGSMLLAVGDAAGETTARIVVDRAPCTYVCFRTTHREVRMREYQKVLKGALSIFGVLYLGLAPDRLLDLIRNLGAVLV